MAKIQIEVCLISARGLRRSSSFWKLQRFAVAWIKPDQKFCSKIDSSGSSNPIWRTKFAVSIDDSTPNLQDICLTIEVYSREPIFLREKLYGTATVQLKEFFLKFANSSDGLTSEIEEVGSFQLRKKKSDKSRGFVDVSVRISDDRGAMNSHTGKEGVYKLPDDRNSLSVNIADGSGAPFQSQQYPYSNALAGNYPQANLSSTYAMPTPSNYPTTSAPRPPRTPPPPPPPPSHVGFMPTFLPAAGPLPQSYINMPSSGAGGRAGGPGFGMGVGAGAVAAGAVIFGDDFMSGFDYPMGLNAGSLTIATDPPF